MSAFSGCYSERGREHAEKLEELLSPGPYCQQLVRLLERLDAFHTPFVSGYLKYLDSIERSASEPPVVSCYRHLIRQILDSIDSLDFQEGKSKLALILALPNPWLIQGYFERYPNQFFDPNPWGLSPFLALVSNNVQALKLVLEVLSDRATADDSASLDEGLDALIPILVEQLKSDASPIESTDVCVASLSFLLQRHAARHPDLTVGFDAETLNTRTDLPYGLSHLQLAVLLNKTAYLEWYLQTETDRSTEVNPLTSPLGLNIPVSPLRMACHVFERFPEESGPTFLAFVTHASGDELNATLATCPLTNKRYKLLSAVARAIQNYEHQFEKKAGIEGALRMALSTLSRLQRIDWSEYKVYGEDIWKTVLGRLSRQILGDEYPNLLQALEQSTRVSIYSMGSKLLGLVSTSTSFSVDTHAVPTRCISLFNSVLTNPYGFDSALLHLGAEVVRSELHAQICGLEEKRDALRALIDGKSETPATPVEVEVIHPAVLRPTEPVIAHQSDSTPPAFSLPRYPATFEATRHELLEIFKQDIAGVEVSASDVNNEPYWALLKSLAEKIDEVSSLARFDDAQFISLISHFFLGRNDLNNTVQHFQFFPGKLCQKLKIGISPLEFLEVFMPQASWKIRALRISHDRCMDEYDLLAVKYLFKQLNHSQQSIDSTALCLSALSTILSFYIGIWNEYDIGNFLPKECMEPLTAAQETVLLNKDLKGFTEKELLATEAGSIKISPFQMLCHLFECQPGKFANSFLSMVDRASSEFLNAPVRASLELEPPYNVLSVLARTIYLHSLRPNQKSDKYLKASQAINRVVNALLDKGLQFDIYETLHENCLAELLAGSVLTDETRERVLEAVSAVVISKQRDLEVALTKGEFGEPLSSECLDPRLVGIKRIVSKRDACREAIVDGLDKLSEEPQDPLKLELQRREEEIRALKEGLERLVSTGIPGASPSVSHVFAPDPSDSGPGGGSSASCTAGAPAGVGS